MIRVNPNVQSAIQRTKEGVSSLTASIKDRIGPKDMKETATILVPALFGLTKTDTQVAIDLGSAVGGGVIGYLAEKKLNFSSDALYLITALMIFAGLGSFAVFKIPPELFSPVMTGIFGIGAGAGISRIQIDQRK